MVSEFRSAELNELFSALSKAQSEMKVAEKDSSNPFFKSSYANLKSIIEASRPALCKNNLSIIQRIISENEQEYLVTMLCHSSGQWISSQVKINPVKSDPQSLGSCITYLRRYMYASITGVYDGFEDDDGNVASSEHTPSTHIPEKTEHRDVQQSFDGSDLVSEKQVKFISFQIGQNRDLLKNVLQKYGVSNIQSIKKSDAQHALAYIESQKTITK